MKALLDYIARYESGGDYNAIYHGIERRHRPHLKLTDMTIKQVLDWQDSIDRLYRSEASGRYQFMEDTLRSIYIPAGFDDHDKFDERTQDALAIYLLRRRGLDAFMTNKLTVVAFCNNIAREWASMPVVSGSKFGRSYYDGDGLNHTKADPYEFISIVTKTRGEHVTPPQKPAPKGFLEILWQAITKFFRSLSMNTTGRK